MSSNAHNQLCRVTFTTISVGQQPEHEIEVMADWEILEGLQVIDKDGFDDVKVLDLSQESLSDFIARSCVSIADEYRQCRLEIAFSGQDLGFQQEVDPSRIEARISEVSGDRVVVVRFIKQ